MATSMIARLLDVLVLLILSEQIAPAHIAETIQYRSLDRDC